jgi:hypothetical protein
MMNGAIVWVYTAEVVVDSALGLCIMVLWLFVLLLSLTTNYMMSGFLKSWGTFWLFGGLQLIGGVYCLIFIKETAGLTDKQKKYLYAPK